MATKSTSKRKSRPTTLVPVTTLEELPVLNERERAELLRELEAAQRDIKVGHYTDYDPKTFKNRLLRIYRSKKR